MASPLDVAGTLYSTGLTDAEKMQYVYYLRNGLLPAGAEISDNLQRLVDYTADAGLTAEGKQQIDDVLSGKDVQFSTVDAAKSPTNPTNEQAPAAATLPPVNTANLSAKTILTDKLAEYGLSSLGDKLWTQYLSGVPIETVVSGIRQTPEYAARFPAMAQLAAKGRAINESTYINYEQQAAQLMRAAGLPPGFYDTPDDFAKLIGNEVSPVELAHRINDGYLKVTQAPKEVRDAYQGWFGVSGDAALAASFLDPDVASTVLDKHLAEAQLHGFGSIAGFDINQDQANRATDFTQDPNQLQSAVGRLGQMRPLLNETVGEATNPTTPDINAGTGLDAILGNDALATDALHRREIERQAEFGGSAGSNFGTKGSTLGSAR